MNYKVFLSQQALEDLKQFNEYSSALILSWLKTNLNNTYNPRNSGKALNKLNLDRWIYSFGRYHILSLITNDKIIVLKITTHQQAF